MCMSQPKMPKMPEPPPPQAPPPPAPLPEPAPDMPAPPPENVGGGDEAPKIKKRTSKRKQLQQSSSGANALRIPLNTGDKGKKSSLNIPK